MLKEFIEDAMSQVFLISNGYYNPTRIVLLFSIIEGKIDDKNRINKNDIIEYLYRYYIVNKEIASHNPNLSIRTIPKYGINDFNEILNQELKDWDENSKNHVLKYDNEYIYIDFVVNESSTNNIRIIGNMLMEKYFNKKFIPPFELKESELYDDKNLELFGKSNFLYLALEDIQYCPLCEETSIENLYAVHIVPSEYCLPNELADKNNSMIFCREHANDYLNNKFYFDNRGFIKNVSSSIVNNKMHLDLSIRRKKQEYLIKYNDILNKNNQWLYLFYIEWTNIESIDICFFII